MTTTNPATLPQLMPVALPRHIQRGFVYKASGDALKRDGVAHWLVVHAGITTTTVVGFDACGSAADTRLLRNTDLVKRKPLGLAPMRALRLAPTEAA